MFTWKPQFTQKIIEAAFFHAGRGLVVVLGNFDSSKIRFNTNGLLKQFNKLRGTQMSTSVTSQINSDPQLNVLLPN